MIVFGIDPGTAATGYGVIKEDESGNLEVLDYGVVSTRSDLSLENRLKIILTQFHHS